MKRIVGRSLRLNNFQGLRAVAASLVVASHIYLEANRFGMQVIFFSRASTYADLGVAIFFALSGWLMGAQLTQSENKPKMFILRRFLRIYPLYLLCTLGVIFYQIFVSKNFDFIHWASSLLFLSQLSGSGHPTLYVGWTLEYEMFFYLLVAACIVLKNANLRWVVAAFVLTVACLVGVFPWLVMYFAMGLLGQALPRPVKHPSHLFSWLTCGLLASLLAIHVESGLGVYDYVGIYGIEIALLLYLLANTHQVNLRFLSFLGDASYAQYLVHVPLLTIAFTFMPQNWPSWVIAVLSYGAVLSLSLLVWRFIDEPLQKTLNRKLTSS